MSDTDGIHICPPGTPHSFKAIRSRSSTSGPPWHYFKGCTRCPALLLQVVSVKTDEAENVLPFVSTFVIAPGRDPVRICPPSSKSLSQSAKC